MAREYVTHSGIIHFVGDRVNLSTEKVDEYRTQMPQIKEDNTAAGGVTGGLIGSLFGPIGTLMVIGIGAAIGNENSPQTDRYEV